MNITFCRTLVDEWMRCGLTDAVVAPGSRSTPLALAAADRLATHVILDERAASFTALGLALTTGRPVLVVCTSGTAAAEFHAAVVEASQAFVPLLVCTADRPPEAWDIGSAQTIDQVGLYAQAVRWAVTPGPPDASTAHTWRGLAARAFAEATGDRPGPVHLDLSFREPLVDTIDASLPDGRDGGAPWAQRPAAPAPTPAPAELARWCAGSTRPLIVSSHAGGVGVTGNGVPVLADHRGPLTGTVPNWDLLARDARFLAEHRPDLVIRNGAPVASKALNTWLTELDVPQVAVTPGGRWIDPHHRVAMFVGTGTALEVSADPGWTASWHDAGERAARAIDEVLAAHDAITEPGVSRHLFATRRTGSTLVVSSSMPIRDLESFAHPRADVTVLANRGANGIDGVTSTALGVALSGATTTLLTGDLAFLHDSGALTGIAHRDVDLTIVVNDNGGGGIFSFVPQHDVLPHPRFEQLFGTPQHVDLAALADVHRIPHTAVSARGELADAIEWSNAASGVRMIVVSTDREANVVVHDELVDAVRAALR